MKAHFIKFKSKLNSVKDNIFLIFYSYLHYEETFAHFPTRKLGGKLLK